MKISLPLKPLSINDAFQGRRFKTKECKKYCSDVMTLLLKSKKVKILGMIEIHYKFYLKNCKKTDGDNLVKVLTDCIVELGIIEDDRMIMRYVIEKYLAPEDSIEIEISKFYK